VNSRLFAARPKKQADNRKMQALQINAWQKIYVLKAMKQTFFVVTGCIHGSHILAAFFDLSKEGVH